MTISIDRNVCCDLNEAIAREWLVTNGLGGYAAGTVAGVLTRRQHGLLVAMLPRSETPHLMLAKIDEEVHFDQRTYYLGTNEYQDGTFNPAGFVHLESFRLEDGFPIFTYRFGAIDGLFLEKKIWMTRGHNTTFVQYRVLRNTTGVRPGYLRNGTVNALEHYPAMLAQTRQSLTLTLLPLVAYRPYDQHQYGNLETYYGVQVHRPSEGTVNGAGGIALPLGAAGCTIQASSDAHPYHILALGHPDSATSFVPTGVWYWHFLHRHDSVVNRPFTDDLYLPGIIRATLWPGDDATLTLVVSSEEPASLPVSRGHLAELYHESCERQRRLVHTVLHPPSSFGNGDEAALRILPLKTAPNPHEGGRDFLAHLLRAGDHLIVQGKLYRDLVPQPVRFLPTPFRTSYPGYGEPQTTLLAGFFRMEHRTRDTLIALPGLLLVPGYFEQAQEILHRLTSYFLGGLLPDRLPTPERPLVDSDYSNADTTLWYFYALDHYLRTTRNYQFLEEVFPFLKECINRYIHGTDNGVHVDHEDGLLYAGKPGKALTWMNAYTAAGQPITPRAGKPVELSALWYHALSLMHEWSHYLSDMGIFGHNSAYYQQWSMRCEEHFHRCFWYNAGNYLYDVIDGPDGPDASLRPNQLFALSLRYPILRPEYRQRVIEAVTQELLTPYGLRTLAPRDPAYRGTSREGHDRDVQLRALYHGSVWPWLMGPYMDALLSLWSQADGEQEQAAFREHLWRNGVQLLEPFYDRFQINMLGSCGGSLDGNPPYQISADSQFLSSALSVSELLRSYHLLAQLRASKPERVYSR